MQSGMAKSSESGMAASVREEQMAAMSAPNRHDGSDACAQWQMT